jgi:hypothetical protein
VSRRLASVNPGLRSVRLTKYYDLFLLVCPFLRDVWYANAVQGWRDRCKVSVCWIDELWTHNLGQLRYWLPVLKKFDYVILGTTGSARALGEAIGRPCHEVQGGVDTIRFSPYPNPPARVIDVYSIGRRWEGIHQRLRQSTDTKMFYVYDTVQNPGDCEVADYSQHREHYANIAKRSRFFTVTPSRLNRDMTSPERGQDQVAIGFRYFEGSAAGAVLVGQAPDCAAFRKHFDWPQAVIEVLPDGSDVLDVIAGLSAEPERIREISRRNVEQALRRHDWVYRWKEILAIAGLQPTAAMHARLRRLEELAATGGGRAPGYPYALPRRQPSDPNGPHVQR